MPPPPLPNNKNNNNTVRPDGAQRAQAQATLTGVMPPQAAGPFATVRGTPGAFTRPSGTMEP